MKIGELYSGGYMKREHLNGADRTFQIAAIEVMEFDKDAGGKERKAVLEFESEHNKLVLCKTNAETIAAMYGEDTGGWIGKLITLYDDPTIMFGSRKVGGIRIRPTVEGAPAYADAPFVDAGGRARF